MKQVVESDVFDKSHSHMSFLKLKTNLTQTLSERDLKGTRFFLNAHMT